MHLISMRWRRLRSVLPVLLLAVATTDAAGASPSCALPRHPVTSEDAAVDTVMAAVDAAQLLRSRRLSLECVQFISSQNADEPRYSISLHEKHDAQCGGDPNFAPRVFTVNVASNGRMTTDAYDIERDQPLRCPPQRANTPDDVVYDFYRWYLTQDRTAHDPVFNARKQMAHYVSRGLLHLVDTNKWRTDVDYFTKARGSDPVWINSIEPEHAHVRGNEATVDLTLGLRVTNAQISKTIVTLKMEDGVWKIMDVRSQFWEHWDYPEHWVSNRNPREQIEASQPASDTTQDKAPNDHGD